MDMKSLYQRTYIGRSYRYHHTFKDLVSTVNPVASFSTNQTLSHFMKPKPLFMKQAFLCHFKPSTFGVMKTISLGILSGLFFSMVSLVYPESKTVVNINQTLIDSENIGGIFLGMTQEDLESLGFTCDKGIIEIPDPSGLVVDKEEAMIISNDEIELMRALWVENKVATIYVTSVDVKTDKNIRTGSSIEELLKVYPNATLFHHFLGADSYFVVPGLLNIQFHISEDFIYEFETLEYDGSESEVIVPRQQINQEGTIELITLK